MIFQPREEINEDKEIKIGRIGNYYGSLKTKVENGKHYWSIKNWNGHNWEKIPEYLYDALIKFNQDCNKDID